MISSSPRPQTAPVDLTPSTVLRQAWGTKTSLGGGACTPSRDQPTRFCSSSGATTDGSVDVKAAPSDELLH
ncbi:MAG TPA: hypothetical protein VGH56_11865, partial [Solirubrobacteraceae bacterium]